MADPQTANKFLYQPARGADVGTWDTPMNANTGVIDQSFGGVATVALTNSNVVLSGTQYQCAFIVFTGAISANIQITFPAVGSFYTIQNLTTNTSAFYLTAATTVSGGRVIGLPPGEAFDIMTDGTNVKFRNFGRIGSYEDWGVSSSPSWLTACTVPPYLNCDGTLFSSATYPVLATILGTNVLPDAAGRVRFALNQGTGRITSSGGIDGNTAYAAGGSQSFSVLLSSRNIPLVPYTDSGHAHATTNAARYAGTTFATGAAGADFSVPINASTANLTSINTGTATTNIVIGSSSPTAATGNALPPGYVGGLTFIRAG